jgi:hypothetical protein
VVSVVELAPHLVRSLGFGGTNDPDVCLRAAAVVVCRVDVEFVRCSGHGLPDSVVASVPAQREVKVQVRVGVVTDGVGFRRRVEADLEPILMNPFSAVIYGQNLI